MSRVVLVTGGSRGIGLACARAFEAQGDRVAITYRNKPVDDLFSLRCDQTNGDEVDAAFGAIEDRWGPVEVLVANAGITNDTLLLRMGEDAWREVIDTNLTGAYRVAKRAAAKMVRARAGRLVFVSSVNAVMGAPGQANYAASKAGLIGLARALAKELGSRNITSNVVMPGFIRTDMTAALPVEWQQMAVDGVPLGRAGEPEDVAGVVTFLASPAAAYITGAVVPVDGGFGMGH
ncbi:MAG TPA: 3-oxoacyl-ACP reductase FabG [Acidimicrobiales bacterium]|jgi:3-oxoacyl-[acyl-carrier protein] reductase|nr:3-oxoacyl-ACP reductase FabG [Acidimicrobiales bacterium]